MKAKTAKSVCRRKFNYFCDSIDDFELREMVKKNSIITGGAIASMLLGEPVNDFDIYFRTRNVAFEVAKYYTQQFAANPPSRFKYIDKKVEVRVMLLDDRVKVFVQSAGIATENSGDEYLEQTDIESGDAEEELPKYRPIFLTSNAITLSDKVQLVVRFSGEPEEIHENYDFVHCMNYWTSWNNKLVLRPESLESLLARDLRYVGSLYPLASVIRTRKFIRRGWSCTAGQYLKMAMQLSELDLKSLSVLEEQLTGVDMAYFLEVIEALRSRDSERVDAAYLVELIDRIF